MARPGLRNHPKFKRLLAMLRIPEAHLYGHLQMLWDAAYEFGEKVGDSIDVEINAGWSGEPGMLCQALASCAGDGRHGFIEPDPDREGRWIIHDLFDHAPQYVQRRMEREASRVQRGQTISDIRRAAANEKHLKQTARHLQSDAGSDEQMATSGHQVSANDSTPSPSPSPKEITATTVVQQAGPRQRKRRTRDEITSSYPEAVRTVANSVLSAWRKEDPDGRPIVPDVALLAANLNLIFREHPDVVPESLIDAARSYLAKDKFRYASPQFFFGRGKGDEQPHWIAEYRFAQHTAARRSELQEVS